MSLGSTNASSPTHLGWWIMTELAACEVTMDCLCSIIDRDSIIRSIPCFTCFLFAFFAR